MSNISTTQFPTLHSPVHIEKNAYSSLLHMLAQVLFLASFVLPSSIQTPIRRLLFFPIAGIFLYLAFFTTTGGISSDTVLGPILITQATTVLDFVLLHDARREFKRKCDTNGDKLTSSVDGAPGETLKQRFVWGLSLLANMRGYGWSWEPSPGILPPRPLPDVTRSDFIQSQLKKIVLNAVIAVISHILNTVNPALHLSEGIQGSNVSWGWRMLAILGFAAVAYAHMSIAYQLCAVVTVATGVLKPQAWPDFFGKIEDAWCINRFWGRFWHQQLRVLVCSISNFLLPAKVKVSLPSEYYSYIRLTICFLLSGIIHSMSEYMLVNHLPLGPFLFFAVQPLAIIFEKVVLLRCFQDPKNPTRFERLLGFVFVLMWFTWVGPLMINPKIKAGALGDAESAPAWLKHF